MIPDPELVAPFFGDRAGRKRAKYGRVITINIGNLPVTNTDNKIPALFEAVLRYNPDAILFQEMGLNTLVTPKDKQWKAQVAKYLDMNRVKTIHRSNQNDLTGNRLQWGGTAILTQGDLSFSAMGCGADPTGLGRWTWSRIRGQQGIVTRFVSCYRPCANKGGEQSVYAQHRRYFNDVNDDRDPRTAFLIDLELALMTWIGMGDQIILGGDLNQDITRGEILDLFERLDMTNMIALRHDLDQLPASYVRNESGTTIDGLWATPGIVPHRCGYLEAGDFPGDHCALWMDVPMASLLGHNRQTPKSPTARRIQCQNPTVVKRYQRYCRQYILENKVTLRQFRLEASITPGKKLNRAQRREANKIDRLRTQCMLRAEKKCRKLNMGNVAFSAATDGPGKRILWWQLALKRRRGGQVSTTLWKRRKLKARIRYPIAGMSEIEMNAKLTEAYREYRTAKKDARIHRDEMYNKAPTTHRKRILVREEQRRQGMISKLVNGKLGNTGVTKVEIVDADGEHILDENGAPQVCRTQREILDLLSPINESKGRASEHTPFMQEPLLSAFGYHGKREAIEQVLNGTFQPPPGTDPYAAEFLQFAKRDDAIATRGDSPSYISAADHSKGWATARERTSAGPSNLNFGMFKANALDPLLCQLDASMRTIAYSTGFSYLRGRFGIDVQLLKKSLDCRAHKQRTILLIEGDTNMDFKKLGRETMWTAEATKSLARDNYGGRRGHRAVEVSMNTVLTYNSIFAKRLKAIVMSNDAKGCFDRIAHIAIILCLRRLGASRTGVDSMIQTIQHLKHYIRTAFGDSTDTYGDDPTQPPL